ncbi:Vi polysaccharide biosynthesis UDP-N-acetylglucosamine C-6 dehydrogenase TviB [Gammaproteobacteria bacterium]|jgi:UDP-N-acetyl-D-galactosamine dehydrogenase|nr:Vi polysaccharide biosynthesis UDP-N-acetylglucosamine C-6 dehydrogenase TviB [Gammaproteobacteria bacterium]
MINRFKLANLRIAIIGLGYVGLPLAVEFGKKCSVLGFDVNNDRINSLKLGHDETLEVSKLEIKKSKNLDFTSNEDLLSDCNVFIVTVPTPIDKYKRPNLDPLIKASSMIGKALSRGNVVIYESTVYPGATEEDCVPVLEKISCLKFNKDFFVGYSPERINPGDKKHKLKDIKKVTSGSNKASAAFIDKLYNTIITAGTYKAESIKVAEAAKVIENTQRDLNISLINELAIIFNAMNIDTESVLKAAGTKWNFLPFRPGLVGGHCIGVDPYYLTHKAQELGYHPEIILAGRRLNDGMSQFISGEFIKALANKNIKINNAKLLVLGLAFKENCPDIRNTKVVDVVTELESFNCNVDIYDPWVNSKEANASYDINIVKSLKRGSYDGVLIAVAHKEFSDMGIKKIRSLCKPNNVIYDLKYIFNEADIDLRL